MHSINITPRRCATNASGQAAVLLPEAMLTLAEGGILIGRVTRGARPSISSLGKFIINPHSLLPEAPSGSQMSQILLFIDRTPLGVQT